MNKKTVNQAGSEEIGAAAGGSGVEIGAVLVVLTPPDSERGFLWSELKVQQSSRGEAGCSDPVQQKEVVDVPSGRVQGPA